MEETTKNMVEMTPETVETTHEKSYTLRNLEFGDVFLMTTIITKVGFKEFKGSLQSDEFKAAFKLMTGKGKSNDAALEKVGIMIAFDIAGIILSNFSKCESDIYALLGGLSGMQPNELKKMPLEEAFEMIVDVIQGVNFMGFMQVVSKLLK